MVIGLLLGTLFFVITPIAAFRASARSAETLDQLARLKLEIVALRKELASLRKIAAAAREASPLRLRRRLRGALAKPRLWAANDQTLPIAEVTSKAVAPSEPLLPRPMRSMLEVSALTARTRDVVRAGCVASSASLGARRSLRA